MKTITVWFAFDEKRPWKLPDGNYQINFRISIVMKLSLWHLILLKD